jgi:hypothetical protein
MKPMAIQHSEYFNDYRERVGSPESSLFLSRSLPFNRDRKWMIFYLSVILPGKLT